MSDSLQPLGLQHARLPCPLPTLGAYSNSCPLSRWCHPTISSSVIPFSSSLQSFLTSGSFPVLRIRWPKYWSFSFSISPSNEYSGPIYFRMDWLDLSPRNSQESSPVPQFKSINSSALSFLYSPTLCEPMEWSRPGFPAHHKLPELTQTRVHWVGDAL